MFNIRSTCWHTRFNGQIFKNWPTFKKNKIQWRIRGDLFCLQLFIRWADKHILKVNEQKIARCLVSLETHNWTYSTMHEFALWGRWLVDNPEAVWFKSGPNWVPSVWKKRLAIWRMACGFDYFQSAKTRTETANEETSCAPRCCDGVSDGVKALYFFLRRSVRGEKYGHCCHAGSPSWDTTRGRCR